jgi:hypothetical protein
MRNRAGQSGITIIGFLFVAAVVLSIAIIGFRVLPSYIEYFSVAKILREELDGARDATSLNEIRRDFERRSGADYIESVHASDIELTKQGNEITVSAAWTKTLHLVGNASLLLEFEASATK